VADTIRVMSGVQQVLTWSALLARWMDFAKSAVALPRDGEGGRLRAAVPALIGLQAVTHALAELDQLPPPERGVGLDRAEVLIERYGDDLRAIWNGTLPAQVSEVVRDARVALEAAAALQSPDRG
jgi:hypothetical protein